MHSRASKVILFFIISTIAVLGGGFKNNTPAPEQIIKNDFLQNIDSLYTSVIELGAYCTTAAENPETDTEHARQLFFNARSHYKKVEFLIAFIDAEQAENFNGGNVTGGDKNVLSNAEIPPKGLQVIEGLLFNSDFTREDLLESSDLCKQICADLKIFRQQAVFTEFNTTLVMDACRREIIRICFMGLTGFDSPVAKNAIPEALTSLESLQTAVLKYSELLSENAELKNKLISGLQGAVFYLEKHSDFNSFDRLYFTREFGNNIYALLLVLHEKSGAPFPEDVAGTNLSLNYKAQNLFSENLLNPYYYSPQKNEKANADQIQLGKLLFYDPVLSVNNKRACASCHQPAKAFTDGLTKSTALDFHGAVKRNAPTLINAIFQGDYFYDLRAEFPETQIDHVIFNTDEFNSSYELIGQKLKESPEYIAAFKKAFPEQQAINNFTITKAIASYVRTLVGMNSAFDKYMQNENDSISDNIKNGYNLFMGKAQCGTCHFAPTFYGTVPPDFIESETEVIGVPLTNDTLQTEIDGDAGRFDRQNVPAYRYAFKTQTVRNIALTAPYMHNGVFTTLQQVLDFYNRGGGAGLHIALPQQTLAADNLHLTKTEMEDIIAFMQSLTDTAGLTSFPQSLPAFPHNHALNSRKSGGEY